MSYMDRYERAGTKAFRDFVDELISVAVGDKTGEKVYLYNICHHWIAEKDQDFFRLEATNFFDPAQKEDGIKIFAERSNDSYCTQFADRDLYEALTEFWHDVEDLEYTKSRTISELKDIIRRMEEYNGT